eukprot:m.9436 g.9436  ORF g.9436 m.9436 type:complete len:79 (+) comp21353_c0_seq3:102-338(+)
MLQPISTRLGKKRMAKRFLSSYRMFARVRSGSSSPPDGELLSSVCNQLIEHRLLQQRRSKKAENGNRASESRRTGNDR